MARKTDVLIIGAGQAGLALSRHLTDLDIDHVILDRGAVGQRWRAERWASLQLLTPNWMTRLPGWRYDGDDPQGFMHKDQVVGMLGRYARSFDAPVAEFTEVESLRQTPTGYRIRTSNGIYVARSVVIATGACDRPAVPGFAASISPAIAQVTTRDYIHPRQLEPGGVLVVGGSATGVQLAEEIHLAGRPVTLAAGAHVRLPRRYRGRDILDWFDRCGMLSEARDPAVPAHKALSQPSLQLIGSDPPRDINLRSLSRLGVRCVGRVVGADGNRVGLGGTLAADVAEGELRRKRTLERVDTFIRVNSDQAEPAPQEDAPFIPQDAALRELDLAAMDIRTILWATGFRRSYPWLDIPVLDRTGEIIQCGGITPCAGLYTLGLPFMRRRNSTFIDGAGQDAADIATHILRHLDNSAHAAA